MRNLRLILCAALAVLLAVAAQAAPTAAGWQHALTLFGEAKYPPWFRHFEYVNPQAPKGGRLKLAQPITFDSVNLFILKGVKAPGLELLNESMMTPSFDEPQAYYPLLAEAFRLDPERRWIEFRLNPRARWHDGKPVTPEDVVFSLQVLKEKADPIYRLTFAAIREARITGPRRVQFIFAEPLSREAPILAAVMPILPRHYYETRDFAKTTLEPPLGSGPYRISKLEAGRTIRYERVKDYWARNLPVNTGRFNFDEIRYDVYRDDIVALEALKAGEIDLRQESIARNWATAYDTPALRSGRMLKEEIPNLVPQGMQAFFFNLRRPVFADRAVREAIALTLDYEWTNKTLFYGAYKRNTSFFQYTPFAATSVPEREEKAFLEPYRDQLPPELFEKPFALPVTDASGQNRANLLKAQHILEEAGYRLEDGKRIDPHTGEPLTFQFLLNQLTMQRVIQPMRKGLRQLGIDASIRIVDDAQYQKRLETRDFDVISNWVNLGIFYPGVEQMNLWHSSQADIEGSLNLTGLKAPAVDAAVEAIQNAHTLEALTPPARALDRILLWEHVAIPHWHNNTFRAAWWDKFGRPKISPPYNLALDCWWVKPEKVGKP